MPDRTLHCTCLLFHTYEERHNGSHIETPNLRLSTACQRAFWMLSSVSTSPAGPAAWSHCEIRIIIPQPQDISALQGGACTQINWLDWTAVWCDLSSKFNDLRENWMWPTSRTAHAPFKAWYWKCCPENRQGHGFIHQIVMCRCLQGQHNPRQPENDSMESNLQRGLTSEASKLGIPSVVHGHRHVRGPRRGYHMNQTPCGCLAVCKCACVLQHMLVSRVPIRRVPGEMDKNVSLADIIFSKLPTEVYTEVVRINFAGICANHQKNLANSWIGIYCNNSIYTLTVQAISTSCTPI